MQELRKELFFPTPIYFVDLEDSQALNEYLKTRIYAWRDRDQAGIVRSNARRSGSWHSPTSMGEMPEFDLFRNKIGTALNGVFQDQKYSPQHKAFCQNMWANINPGGGYNRSHTHPGALWSGVYYVQTPPDCGRVVFQDPRVQSRVMLPHSDSNADSGAEQWSEIFHQAIAGRLILFPSWLSHEVESNSSELLSPDGDRISISFNYGQGQVSG